MKRYKRVLILLGVLVVVVAATVAVTHAQKEKEDIKASGETFLTIPGDTVTALSWQTGDTSLSFHRDGKWTWDDDAAFPVDATALGKLLLPFEDMAAAFVIRDVEDYGQYGLDEPVCTIDLTAGGADYTVKLGAFSALDNQRYVDIGDGNVYLVADDPMDEFDAELPDLILNDELPELDGALAFTVSGEADIDAAYTEDGDSYDASDVYFAGALPLDTSSVDSWLNTLQALDLTDYATYNATGEELASYGLDQPSLTVTVTPKEGAELTLELSQVTPEDAESEDDTLAYIRVNGSQIVYNLDPGDYRAVARASADDLRHRELFTPEFESVTGIDVTLEGEKYTFALEENEDGDNVWTYNGVEADAAPLQSALEALSVSSFTGEGPTGREEISLTLRLTDEAHPELTLTLYRRDGSLCEAELNGQMVGTVARSSVVDLIEAVNGIVL